MQINVTNLTGKKFSLDVKVGQNVIRRNLGVGATVDIGDQATVDEVNQCAALKALVAKGKVSVTTTVSSDDVKPDLPVKTVQPADLNMIVAACLGLPIAAATNGCVAAVDWATNATLTIANQPDVPRNITCTLTDANSSVSAGTLTVTGKDVAGNTITESIGYVAAKATFTGTKIFAQVTGAAIAAAAGGTPATDTVIVGYGNKIGLPTGIVATTAVKHVSLAGRQASPTIVAGVVGLASVDASAGTYNGSKALLVHYNPGE